MNVRLTKKSIETVTLPASGCTTINDTEVRGLSLKLYPSSKRTWHFYYRGGPDRQQRNAKIGTYPSLSVDAARKLALQYAADVSRGVDPVAIKKEKTVTQLAEHFVKSHVERKLKPRSRDEYQRLIDKWIVPELGRLRLDAVKTEVVQRLHHKMGGTRRQANFVMAVLRKMLNDAIALGWRKDTRNPVAGITPYKENKRQRYLDRKEFAKLWDVLQAEMAIPRNHDGILAIVLLLLTGRRRGEILNLTWDEVDLDNGRMTLKDSKVGAHDYQLSPQVIGLLAKARAERSEAGPGAHVIRGRAGKGRLVGLPHIWLRVRRAAGLDDVRLHDLRHSYASFAIDCGAGLAEVKELLGHKEIATTMRYIHLQNDRIRETVKAVADGMLAAVSKEPDHRSAA